MRLKHFVINILPKKCMSAADVWKYRDSILLQESLSSFNAVVDQLAQETGCDSILDKVVFLNFYIYV